MDNLKPLPPTLHAAHQEILALRDRVQVLRNESITDPLTGLLNRRGGMRALERAIKRAGRTDRPLAVIALDIDHFKKVNDTYGHDEGDLVLQRVAQALRVTLRETDAGVRMGGEEFLVITDNGWAGASTLAEKLVSSVERTCFAGGDLDDNGKPQGWLVTISAGVALWCGQEVDMLLRAADLRLYEAKRQGRNRVV